MYSTCDIRKQIKETSEAKYFNEIKRQVGNEIDFDTKSIDSLNNLDASLVIRYNFKMPQANSGILYFNPNTMFSLKSNPYFETDRIYPIELPYRINETHIANVIIPKGYRIEEMPTSVRYKLGELENSYYEYNIDTTTTTITFKSVLKVNKAYFPPEDYDLLKEFYKMIIKKENEQIVFKKR